MTVQKTQIQRKLKVTELQDFDRVRTTLTLILRYDPDEDAILIDGDQLSGLELRGMVQMTHDQVFANE